MSEWSQLGFIMICLKIKKNDVIKAFESGKSREDLEYAQRRLEKLEGEIRLVGEDDIFKIFDILTFFLTFSTFF